MRKQVALLLAVVLICAAAFASGEVVEVTGDWYLKKLFSGGSSLSPVAMGMQVVLSLREDGTAVMTTTYGETEETETDTWALSGSVITITDQDGKEMTVSWENDQLKWNMGSNGIMVFSREAPAAITQPRPVPAESEDAFLGSWTLSAISLASITLPAEETSVQGSLVIEPGKVTMDSGNGPFETASTFADGKLIFGDETGTLTLELNDDGSISITSQYGEEAFMIMYFEKAEQ